MAALKVNQVELERRSGITDTTWAAWRAGKLPSSKPFLPVIATTLQVDLAVVTSHIDRDKAARAKPSPRIDTPAAAQAWIDTKQPVPAEQDA